jgi:two-component system, NarL family, sensor histidine kinase LiaS
VNGGIFALRRLRWKLALSYTLVTVLALLVAELILVAALVAFAISPVLPSLAARYVGDEVAPRLETGLEQSPPDEGNLRAQVDSLTGETNVEMVPQREGGGLDLSLGPEDGSVFVVDENRRLLASSEQRAQPPADERFDAERFPGLAPLLSAALRGEEDPWSLGAYSPGRDELLAAAPVEDDGGRTLGAVVTVVRLPNLAGPLFTVIAVGALALAAPAALLGMVFGFLTARGMTRRLGRLARAAQSWSRGDFSVVVKDRSKDEIGQLSRELNDMAAQLENLIQTRGELATLEARNRFARDLHDSVKQQVFATSFQVAAARALIESDTKAAEAHLAQADELVRGAQKELNALIGEMRPAALEGRGLAAALRDYVKGWTQSAEIPVEVHVRGEREVPLRVEQALFRVAQEALANVARHSGAKKAEVDLAYTADTLTLRVSDDGKGFDPVGDPGDGFGLQSMRERVEGLGGRLNVESGLGAGTQVTCVCPLDASGRERV